MGHEIWTKIRAQAHGGPQEGVEAARERNGLLCATLKLDPVSSWHTAQGGPYGGWYWLGTRESRAIKNRDRNTPRDLIARRYRVAEVRDAGNHHELTSPPLGDGDLRWWRAEVKPAEKRAVLDVSQPLIGIDVDMEIAGDGRAGPGVPDRLLVPLPSLVALLGLRPGPPCTYEDDAGVGLALVIWRAEYDVSDYHLAWPRTHGSGIVIRPDLLANLAATTGEDRLVVRDFVVGVPELAPAAVG